MKRLVLLAVLLALPPALRAQQAVAPAAGGACVTCHSDPARVPRPEQREPVAAFADDIHAARGLSCADCHGGRADVDLAAPDAVARAHDPAAGWRGAPGPADVPEFCGRCHADAAVMGRFNPDVRVDQLALYRTSVHGQKLAAGDTKVAQCLSCHGRHPDGSQRALAHGLRAVSDTRAPVHPTHVAETCARCHADAAYMQPYGIPTDQYEEYSHSVHHAQMMEHDDLGAPTCNDCHGNHGAHPPEVADMSFVCGACHVRQAELFRQATMKPAFDDLGMGECIVCHSNHRVEAPDDAMLFHEPLAEGAAATGCWSCHPDAGDPALAASTRIYGALRSLEARITAAKAVIHEAGFKGMPVADAEFRLTGATDALVEARALVHRFHADEVLAATAKGEAVADEAGNLGNLALQDLYFRHRWLAVSLVGIALVILSLALKVRQADRRWHAARQP